VLTPELWVELRDGSVIGLEPVPAIHLPNLEKLLAVREHLRQEDRETAALGITRSILMLHPRLDRPGVAGCSLAELAEGEEERLFEGGALAALNQITPPEVNPADKDHCPPWSSGDYITDLLADYTTRFGDLAQALVLLQSCPMQRVLDVGHRLHEIAKGPEEREKAELTRYFWEEWMPDMEDYMPEGYFE
jgi:hypothetical protein